jgi:hypothetical protein
MEKRKKKSDDGQLLLAATDKRQIRPLVREGAPQRQDSKFKTELISDRKYHSALTPRHTDWLSVVTWLQPEVYHEKFSYTLSWIWTPKTEKLETQ